LCKKWKRKIIKKYPNSGLGDHNYCRNFQGIYHIKQIWCYTTDPDKKKENCLPLIVLGVARYPLITSKFAGVEERWLPSRSTFKFNDNYYDVETDNKYGDIMFAEFAQETKKSEDCATNCLHKYGMIV